MSHRFIELVVRARRLVSLRARREGAASGSPRRTAARGVGDELTQFSFRLALVIDLAYVGMGALGGAAIGRATAPPGEPTAPRACADSGAAVPPFRPPARRDTAAVGGSPTTRKSLDSSQARAERAPPPNTLRLSDLTPRPTATRRRAWFASE